MRAPSLAWALAALTALLALAAAPAQAAQRPPLIMVSIDGFRADYLDRGQTPTLARIGREGVRALAMRPSFPALTYPNHYTLVTGLRPDHHGLVHNVIDDPAFPQAKFGLGDRAQVRNPRWWEEAEPIWITAKKAGLKTASLFWPGDEAPIHGLQADRWRTFDAALPPEARVDQLLAWIDADHPAFADLYFDDVDTAGHNFGPDSPELNAALARVDAAVARLLAGLKTRGLAEDKINLIVVADHGMTRADHLVMLDDVAGDSARLVTSGATAMLAPIPGHEAQALERLVGPHDHFECWKRQDVPARFHYGTNPRISPIVCLAKLGWYLTNHAGADGKTPSPGQHGADPYTPDMAALFVAKGPGLREGLTIPVMDNVDVYPVAMRLLGLRPLPNDGAPQLADRILKRR